MNNFTKKFIQQLRAMHESFRRDFDRNRRSWKLLNCDKNKKKNSKNIVNKNKNNVKWNSKNLNFFDLNYDDKIINNDAAVIKYTKKNAHYKNIHLFITKAKKMIIIKNSQLI